MTVELERVMTPTGKWAHLWDRTAGDRALCGQVLPPLGGALAAEGVSVCMRCDKARNRLADQGVATTIPVPVWKVTWGTCAVLIPAATKDDAVAIARARDRAESPGRVPREIIAHRATRADIEAAVEAGKWAPPAPDPVVAADQEELFSA